MVSTRGVKFKFSEGERVLCYEPDPTKAKVLYDSRVLQVFPAKDTKGKKQIEYLIHFQGWNASWDRRVPEDFVLKSTEESRALQKDLADGAQIKLSIKSNRVLAGPGLSGKEKKRKRRLSETIRETIEQEKKRNDDSTMLYETVSTEDESYDVSSETNDVAGISPDVEPETDDDIFTKFFPLHIPDALKSIIEKDYHQINDKNKVLSVPSDRPVLLILEDYVRYFASRFATRRREKQKGDVKEKDKMFLTLDLCKEVVDSLRISFDFYLHTILLYKKEKQQADMLKQSVQQASNQNVRPAKGSAPLSTQDSKDRKNLRSDKEGSRRDRITGRYLRSKVLPVEEPIADVKEPKPHNVQSESGRSTPTTVTSGGSTSGLYSLGEEDLAGYRHMRCLSHVSQNWTLLPDAHRTPTMPVLNYGAVHLLRLIVKLPEILYKMKISVERKRILLRHLELILEYLSSHSTELFLDANYLSATEM